MHINQYQLKRISQSTAIHVLLIIVSVTCLFPLFWMVRSSLMSNATIFVSKSLIPVEMNFRNYYLAWTQGKLGLFCLNSLIYTVCVVFGIVLVSSLAAFAFSRLKFFGSNFFF